MRTLTPADVSAGLPAAAAASALLGKAGASILLVLLFLAVTSASSAELIAVSSILTYDIYKVSFTMPWTNALFMNYFFRDILTHAQPKRRCLRFRTRWRVTQLANVLCGLNNVSNLKVAFFALCMGLAGLIFFYIGISMGWLYVCFFSFFSFQWC
jgi:urea-proton symporter